MSLKAILESHPIKNLNAVIKSVKSDIAPKLALSKDRKRHSKAKLIEHILALDKMGLLKERPGMYEKPVRAKKVKAVPQAKQKNETLTATKADGTKVVIKKKVKVEPKTEPKVEDKARKTRSDKGGKHSGQKFKVLPSGRKVKHKDGKTEAQLSIELGLKKAEPQAKQKKAVDTKKILKEAVSELSDNFESQVEDKENSLELDEHKYFISSQKPTITVIEQNTNLTKEQKKKLETKAYASFIKEYSKKKKAEPKKAKKPPSKKTQEQFIKELYENEANRISVDDKLKPNYKEINSEILKKILLINPKLDDENKGLLKDYIRAISQNALEEEQIGQSASYAKDLFNPNIIKKGTNADITKRLKKRRKRFRDNSGI